jgi:type IV pilus assembly protein PilM
MGLFKSDGAIGLDLDTGIIRAVELRGTAASAALTAAGSIEIPEVAVVEGMVADPEAVAGALKKLWGEARLRSSKIVLGVSNQGVFMRMATFPKVPDNKLAQVLRFQAGDYFPIPMPQLVLDHAVVGELEGEGGPALEILLVAARRDMLEKSLKALAGASLNPAVVDASPLALMRTLPESQLAGTVLLTDMANGISSLLLVAGGVPRFARVIPHSLHSYAREKGARLADVLNAVQQVAAARGNGQAEDVSAGPPGGWGVALAAEIRSSIGYYQTHNGGSQADSVILSGRGARVGGLAEILQEELEVPVRMAKPLARLGGPTRVQGLNLEQEGPDFAVSIGLALRGLED